MEGGNIIFTQTHGLYGTRLYRIHHNMKQRCYNPNNTKWDNYGGKGIKVCDEWLEYDHENKINIGLINFYNWAINNGYDNTLSIDRIDPNGNYEPSNCRWVDQKFQCNNRNDNKYLEYKGYNFTITSTTNYDQKYTPNRTRNLSSTIIPFIIKVTIPENSKSSK